MLEFFGRFHPVFVHLPIGILLLACIFILLSLRKQFVALKQSIPLILLLGALSAIVSCITGYLLANSGDYEGELVNNHQWMGISVAVIAVILWVIYQKITSNLVLGFVAVGLIVLISITGHLGGSLTHGANYLTEPLKGDSDQSAIPPIAVVNEAFVYQDAIRPLLQNRCYNCHGPDKQKGKLRLDGEEYVLKGGEGGKTVVPGNAEDSELIKRILLPLSDEDHMAPKEKPQLTTNEITLLKWWIDNGADFKKKFKDLPQPAAIKEVLNGLQTGSVAKEISELPTKDVGVANTKALTTLINAGITVVPVSQNSNYLSANFVNAKSFADSVVTSIKNIKEQLIWLRLENKAVNDQVLGVVKECKNATRLSLNYTGITDEGLKYIGEMDELQSLSLVGTKITMNGLLKLAKLKKLKQLYLYQTALKKEDWSKLKTLFPTVKLDSGNYKVPTLPEDTTLLK